MEAAGFDDVRVRRARARTGTATSARPYALAVSGVKPRAGPVAGAAAAPPAEEPPSSRARFAFRFVAGSAAGALFIPIAAALTLRDRLAARRAT